MAGFMKRSNLAFRHIGEMLSSSELGDGLHCYDVHRTT